MPCRGKKSARLQGMSVCSPTETAPTNASGRVHWQSEIRLSTSATLGGSAKVTCEPVVVAAGSVISRTSPSELAAVALAQSVTLTVSSSDPSPILASPTWDSAVGNVEMAISPVAGSIVPPVRFSDHLSGPGPATTLFESPRYQPANWDLRDAFAAAGATPPGATCTSSRPECTS